MPSHALMLPHPPMIVPAVGKGSEKQIQKTTDAYRQAARFLKDSRPEALVIISPHAALYADYFRLSPGEGAQGSFRGFGVPNVSFSVAYDQALGKAIAKTAGQMGLPAGFEGRGEEKLDHGTMVPLYFLREAGLEVPIVRMGFSGLNFASHYRMGIAIARAAEGLGRRVGLVASGDLSHYLKEDGPYGLRPEGAVYDAQIMDIMGRAAFDELLSLPPGLCDTAGECGQRSFLMLAGALDGRKVDAQALSYEGVTGVGYGVCVFAAGEPDESRHFLENQQRELASQRARESLPVRLARASFETYVKTGKRMKLPGDLPQEWTDRRAGVFVSLHKEGELRGCIGTISPTTGSIAEEIVQNAVSAAARDPRFPPVEEVELDAVQCSVDVLGQAEDIDSQDMLDVKKYGVIVSSRGRRGLLLPNLEGVDTVEEQVDIARCKAGIRPGETVSLQRFEVVRYT